MEILNKQDLYKYIETHLENPKCSIAVKQDTNQFKKSFTNIDKNNWTKADVLRQAQSVGQFIEQLPIFGFSNGAVLLLRKKETINGRPRTIEETTLKFSSQPPVPVNQQIEPNITPPMQQVTTHQAPQQMAAPVINGMAYANVPQHELIGMKVKEERYSDLLDKYKKVEDELSQYKSDLRIEKEKLIAAERKLETFEDKWELKMDRALNDKKSFLDTDTGKELVTGLASALPNIIEAIKPKQTTLGMGNPMAGMSELRQDCFVKLKELPEPAIQLLSNASNLIMDVDGFAEALQELINKATQN